MTDKFEVGEIAIYVRPGSPHFGEEVRIESNLEYFCGGVDYLTGELPEDGYEYEFTMIGLLPGIYPWTARPEWLKKKPKPRAIDEKVSWDYLNKLMRKEVKV
jgi:hypothetical protein